MSTATRSIANLRSSPVAAMLLWDIGLPLAAYFGSRGLGVGGTLSLLVAGAVAMVRVAYVAIRERRFDGVSALMVAMFAVGLVLAHVTDDARLLLAAKSSHVALIALALLGSWALGRPAMFALAKRFGAENGEVARRWDELYDAVPAFRRTYVVMTLVWSGALMAEAAVRVALVYVLPLDAAVAISPVLLLAVIAATTAWSSWYGKRREHHAERLHAAAGVAT
jgi:hypothetical protein